MIDTAAPVPAAPVVTQAAAPGWNVNGIWLFIIGDLYIFGAYFVVYAWMRHANQVLFLASQRTLSQGIGLFNTLLLLTSSWLVAAAVRAQRAGAYSDAARLTIATGLCGLIFLIAKFTEWVLKVQAGFTLTTNAFFQFYYFLTGVHVLHVSFGMIALARLYAEVSDPDARRNSTAESCAVFWHMVDVLWLVIFALLYVMR